MNEQNRDQLKAAIDQLPRYEAGPEIWQQLETRLDNEATQQDNNMKREVATALLPRYHAPVTVWRKLEAALDRKPWRFAGRIAASVLVLVGLGAILVWQLQPAAQIVAPVSEQASPQSPLDLPVAEDLALSVLREQEAELIACLESHDNWEQISQSEPMAALLQLMVKAKDSLAYQEADRERERQLVASMQTQYCQ